MIRRIAAWALALLILAVPGQGRAAGMAGLARVLPGDSRIVDSGDGVTLRLTLSQGVPWRVFTLSDPARLVLDFREVDWRGVDGAALDRSARVGNLRMGVIRPGWSRLVADLSRPLLLERADLRVNEASGRARLRVTLKPGSKADFAAAAGVPDLPGWDLPRVARTRSAAPKAREGGPLVVVLDPGHGGIDPGATEDGIEEKDVVLSFARKLKEDLVRAGGFKVVLTRDDDRFVSLERRVTIAHEARADLFLALHADAVSEGRVRGTSVYTLAADASDAASAALAERHNRADMLAGVDLNGKDDVVAGVLMDLARMETQPRSLALGRSVIKALRKADLPLVTRPLRRAGFSVLKSADIPSILIELGFLSDKRDRANLIEPEWRARMAAGVRDALIDWRRQDAVRAGLVRK